MQMLLQDVHIGHNLRRLREEHGYTQYYLAKELSERGSNLDRTAIVRIESGTRNLKVSDLLLLQAIYDVSFDEFFRDIKIKL